MSSRPTDIDVKIVHGPHIETLTPHGRAEALAVSAGRVAGIGALEELTSTYPTANVTRMPGELLVPGFNDAHVHPLFAAEPELRVNLEPATVTSTDHALHVLREKASGTPPGDWIVGAGYDVIHAPDPQLDRGLLDSVSTEHPIYVIGSTWHAAIANTPALDAITTDPTIGDESGGYFARDGDHLTGWMFELPHMNVAWSGSDRPDLLPALPRPALVGALRTQHRIFNAHGITSYTDALVTPHTWEAYRQLFKEGDPTTRASVALWHTHRDLLDHGDFGSANDEWLRLVGVKLMYDGAISGGTCLCSRPYASATDTGNGIQVMTRGDLFQIVAELHGRGIRACVHANGDRAISDVLDAVEHAQAARPDERLAHRIEHCSLLDDHLIARIAATGCIPIPFSGFIYHHGDSLVSRYGAERAGRVARHRSLLAAGITVAGSSDYPCGPLDVMAGLHSMTTRVTTSGAVVGRAERVDALIALCVYSAGSAHATGEGTIKGRLAPGLLADFTVLSRDIVRNPDWFQDCSVLATWIDGREVWAAPGTI